MVVVVVVCAYACVCVWEGRGTRRRRKQRATHFVAHLTYSPSLLAARTPFGRHHTVSKLTAPPAAAAAALALAVAAM